jgi:hypothetical protein
MYVYQNNKFRSYLVDGIWKEKKFKHITINDKDQLILAAEFGDVFIVEDTSTFKVIKKLFRKIKLLENSSFLEAYKDCVLIGTEKE